ncbi:MAG: hypothetical protein A2Y48_05000 [Nitrospirae bacterium RIFCSPLOW2_12_42_9]|nr:MAG: hypothetical protein A2Y48_05000 [Nitrospirae bacterium RIFCSPLOW2_12_42_9]HAS18029.1 hypothetical protein [Nitrospiraceae bacterium]
MPVLDRPEGLSLHPFHVAGVTNYPCYERLGFIPVSWVQILQLLMEYFKNKVSMMLGYYKRDQIDFFIGKRMAVACPVIKKSGNFSTIVLSRISGIILSNSMYVILFSSFLIISFVTGCTGGSAYYYLERLKSPNEIVKKDAIIKLGLDQETRAVPYLLGFLDSGSTDIRMISVEALGRIGDRQAVEKLIRIVSDENSDLRMKAIESLGKIGDPRAIVALTGVFKREDSLNSLSIEEKTITIWAIGAIGAEDAIPVLTELLSDEDKFIRYNAERSLKKINEHQ